MLPACFADTWYFIALSDRFDTHHSHARRLQARYATQRLITHEAVLTELLAFFSTGGTNARILAAAAAREAIDTIEVVTPDRALFLAALGLYERRPDKAYSLVDCMSMIVMRQRGITHVLTNDHHFRQEGFTVLADAP